MLPSPIRDEARSLHAESVVIDLDADTPSLMRLGYDISRAHSPPLPRAALGYRVDPPRMREGGQAAQVFGLVSFPYRRRGLAGVIHRQITLLEQAAHEHPDDLAIVTSAQEFLAARRRGQRAALLSIEGAHALEGSLDNVEAFARRGVRSLGLLHFSANPAGAPAYGRGRYPHLGLTPFGRDLVAELDRLGVIVDLAHINRKGFLEAARHTRKPPIVSHTGVTGVHAHWRNIDDEQIRTVADRGGCVGVIYAPRFLGRDGIEGVVDHLAHIIAIAGEDTPSRDRTLNTHSCTRRSGSLLTTERERIPH